MSNVLSERTVSSYPGLSVGTALAMESIQMGPAQPIDLDRRPPVEVRLKNYDEMWVSVQCLIRNAINACQRADRTGIRDEDLGTVIKEEVDIIQDIVKRGSKGGCEVVPYTRGYEELERLFPNALLRRGELGTDEQKWFHQRMLGGVSEYYSRGGRGQHYASQGPTGAGARVVVLTSYPYDLLQYRFTRSLELLESHTGMLKGRPQWYTKFNNPKGLERIPLNEATLQIFGDKNMFFQMKKSVRDAVVAIAEKSNWNALTTKERVRLGFELCPEPEIREILMGTLKTK